VCCLLRTLPSTFFGNSRGVEMLKRAVEVQCPECGSKLVYRDGLRCLSNGESAQRWLCRSCGFRFSEGSLKHDEKLKVVRQPGTFQSSSDLAEGSVRDRDFAGDKLFNNVSFSLGKDVESHNVTVMGKGLNNLRSYSCNCRVCVSEGEMKNLAVAENRTQAAGISPQAQTDVKGKIINFLWWMEKQAYAQQTIRGAGSALRALIGRGANPGDPETVKEALAREKTWSPARRRNVINAYTLFLKFSGLTWEKPKCKVPQTIPFIPKEEELDALIAGSGRKTAAFQQVMKETAMRPGEVDRLLWTDIDEERHLIRVNNPEKGSNSGVYKVSEKLIGMLKALPKENIKVFRGISQRSRRTTFERTRKRLAQKLANPRLLQISFATYRHWKATMLQHQVGDTWYVKSFLRHKCIQNTEKYIYIEHAIFGEGADSDQFISKVAASQDEIKKLIETGFEFVLQKDGLAYFRKRK